MKKGVIAVAAALALALAVPAFAADATPPATGTPPTFEQMKADHLKWIDTRIKSLQEEKVCAGAAKTQDDLRTCRAKHKGDMKGHHDEMGMKGGHGGPGGPYRHQGE